MHGQGFLYAISAIVGVLIINQPFFAFMFFLLLVILSYKQQNKRMLVFFCLVVAIFAGRMCYYDLQNQSHLQGNEQLFHVRISGLPNIDGNYLSFQATIDSGEKLQVRYRIKTHAEKNMLSVVKPGMYCLFTGSLSKFDGKRNPGGFDYAAYMYQQAIHWEVIPKTFDHCSDSTVTLLDSLKRYRLLSLEKMSQYYSEESLGIAQSLLFGERSLINKEVLAAYQTLGLIHILVVSGLHVGIITASIHWCLLRIGLTRERSILTLLLFLPVYVILTGGAPSVLRATLMTAVVLIGLRLKIKLHPLDSICFAFLLLIFYQPTYLFHVGFQLSFIISFFLMVSWQTIETMFTGTFARLLAVSFIAELASIPLIIYYFSHFSFWSILVNVVFVPVFTALILPFTFLTFLAMITVPIIAEKLMTVYDIIISFVHSTLDYIVAFPFATIFMGKPHSIIIFLYYVLIIYFFIQLTRQQKITSKLSWSFLPFLSLMFVQLIFPYFNPNGKVTMLDVGQGDCILIELPFRKAVYMIDTGGFQAFFEEEMWQRQINHFDVGQDIVLPALKAKGIRKIDKLIITHGDADHYGGTEALYPFIKIDQLLYGQSVQLVEHEHNFLEMARQNVAQVKFVENGMSWSEGKYRFHILAPEGNERSKNNRSVVIFSELGGLSWLFTGDVERESEKKLLHYYPNLRAHVLKVGHHGSKTSTTDYFINQVQPSIALISVGRNNLYGHPHNEVVNRLESEGVRIFRTDQHGAITYTFSKNKRGFSTYINHEK